MSVSGERNITDTRENFESKFSETQSTDLSKAHNFRQYILCRKEI
jgi:hypothetical protein